MTEKDDYVAPPKKELEGDYVVPPKKMQGEKEYVKPPTNHSTATNATKKEEVIPPKKVTEEVVYPNNSSLSNQGESYFSTPKMNLKFYLTGYLIFMSLFSLSSFLENGFHFTWLLGIGYIILSNYTLSWFSDYQRAKGGSFAWFFTPYGSVKVSALSSGAMNFQKGTVKQDWTGNYKTNTRTDVAGHLGMFFVLMIIIEILKLFITVPLAFFTIFLHKQTITKYRKLVQ